MIHAKSIDVKEDIDPELNELSNKIIMLAFHRGARVGQQDFDDVKHHIAYIISNLFKNPKGVA